MAIFKITIFFDDMTAPIDYDNKPSLAKAKGVAADVIKGGAYFDTITGAFVRPPHRVMEIKIEEEA